MTYEIRSARQDEVHSVLARAKDFYEVSGLPLPFDPVHASVAVSDFINDPNKLVLVLATETGVQGVLAATVSASPLFPVLVAQEVIWWITPAYRGRAALEMIDDYCEWADAKGCAAVGMAGLNDHRVARLYRMAGFKLIENQFMRVL